MQSQINGPSARWHTLTRRRLQTHPSPLSTNNVLLTPPELPPWLTQEPPIHDRFAKLGLFDHTPHKAPNHVLINEYKPGQGIMPHEDGGAYAPVVATVSLGASIVLDIYEKAHTAEGGESNEARAPKWRIFQEPRSLLVTTGSMYTDYMHGIAEREVDEGIGPCDKQTGTGVVNWDLLRNQKGFQKDLVDGRHERGIRVSLTYRDVLKVKEMGKSLKFFPQSK